MPFPPPAPAPLPQTLPAPQSRFRAQCPRSCLPMTVPSLRFPFAARLHRSRRSQAGSGSPDKRVCLRCLCPRRRHAGSDQDGEPGPHQQSAPWLPSSSAHRAATPGPAASADILRAAPHPRSPSSLAEAESIPPRLPASRSSVQMQSARSLARTAQATQDSSAAGSGCGGARSETSPLPTGLRSLRRPCPSPWPSLPWLPRSLAPSSLGSIRSGSPKTS